MAITLPNSYSTDSVYSGIPQFLQDQDAANGYHLWYYLYGICQTIDKINVLTRDNMGGGVHFEADIGPYTGYDIADAQLSVDLTPSDTQITIFGTDATWNVIDMSSSFYVQLVNPINDTSEYILIPSGNYNWLQPFNVITGVTRGYNPTTGSSNAANAISSSASSGADGSVYIEDYFGAPGWSQMLDINRCPDYALPWLGQFVGAGIQSTAGLTRQSMVQRIEKRAGFNRATPAAIVAELVTITNQQLPPNETPLASNQIIVMENTQFATVGGVNQYAFNQYALTLLIPSYVFSTYTYSSLQTSSSSPGTTNATYTSTQNYIGGLGGLYFGLEGSTTPNSASPYVNFVYRYRPAGMQIFVGGY